MAKKFAAKYALMHEEMIKEKGPRPVLDLDAIRQSKAVHTQYGWIAEDGNKKRGRVGKEKPPKILGD